MKDHFLNPLLVTVLWLIVYPQLGPLARYRSRVFNRSCYSCYLSLLNFDCKLPVSIASPDRFLCERWHCNCGILSLLCTLAVCKCPLSLVDGFFFAGQSDILSAAGFLAVIVFFVAYSEFQFGVLAPEECRW